MYVGCLMGPTDGRPATYTAPWPKSMKGASICYVPNIIRSLSLSLTPCLSISSYIILNREAEPTSDGLQLNSFGLQPNSVSPSLRLLLYPSFQIFTRQRLHRSCSGAYRGRKWYDLSEDTDVDRPDVKRVAETRFGLFL